MNAVQKGGYWKHEQFGGQVTVPSQTGPISLTKGSYATRMGPRGANEARNQALCRRRKPESGAGCRIFGTTYFGIAPEAECPAFQGTRQPKAVNKASFGLMVFHLQYGSVRIPAFGSQIPPRRTRRASPFDPQLGHGCQSGFRQVGRSLQNENALSPPWRTRSWINTYPPQKGGGCEAHPGVCALGCNTPLATSAPRRYSNLGLRRLRTRRQRPKD